jgi:methylglutaconyl-CoA hydratase
MQNFETIEVVNENKIATIWLNRPKVHNAFNHIMVLEIITALETLSQDKELRVLIIRGKGESFCSGADIKWMKDMVDYDFEQNQTESLLLAKCLQSIYHFPVPVLTLGQGSVIGGGIGLLATADFAICTTNARFAFSEVTIGLVPAIISFFITQRMGLNKAKELMLSGNPFNGIDAERWGLINYVIDELNVEQFITSVTDRLIKNNAQAIKSTKKLLLENSMISDQDLILQQSATVISKARISPEGKEGMRSFIEKRKPNWTTSNY